MAKGIRTTTRTDQGVSPRLRSLTVKGYKSIIDEQTIEFRPLTILAGANSAGKSSLLQPLLLLKQTLSTPFDPGPMLLDGSNVRLTAVEQFIPRGIPETKTKFKIGLILENSMQLQVTFSPDPGHGIELSEMTIIQDGSEKDRPKISIGMSSAQLEANWPVLKSFRERLLGDLATKHAFKGAEDALWVVVRDRCFLEVELRGPNGLGIPAPMLHSYLFGSQIERIIHVPGLRGNPGRTYSVAAVGNSFPGTFESYVASVINHWRLTKDENLKGLGQDLEALGLTWKVEARPKDDTQVEILVGRLPHAARGGARDLVSIADVGFGVSQTLPVLVALRVAEPGQIVYLEQPEIHLHPRAQRKLANILAAAANRGVIVVVETHSALLLRGVQTLVAGTDILNPSLVKLHWFTRNPISGGTEVVAADLDSDGAYGPDWPEDFDDVSLESEQAYLDAVENRGIAK